MNEFDARYADFPGYIIGITREIWEERGIAALHEYYDQDIVVRSPGSVVVGNDAVIAATLATLSEFPDRRLLGEDVIWCDAEGGGKFSSHRLLSTATHLGHGVYGPATGRKLTYRIMADCHAMANRINDEWLIRDQGAIVRQMGWTPTDYAADLIAREGGVGYAKAPLTPRIDRAGPYRGRGNDDPLGHRYAQILTRIMAADLAVIATDYDRAVQAEYPGGVTVHGREGVDAFWIGLRASLPHATFRIDHQIGRDDAEMPRRAALRWSLAGRHDGWGVLGPPTGADLYVLGIAHAEFGAWGLRREWVLYDEVAVWKQILMQNGGAQAGLP